MHFSILTAAAACILASTASAASHCNKNHIPNGGFEGPANLAPWTASGGTGYEAKRIKQVTSSRDRYVGEFSPGPPSDPRDASTTVWLFQNFTVCADTDYNITWQWAVENNVTSRLDVYGQADPDNQCPDNCVLQTIYSMDAQKPDAYTGSGSVNVPAVQGSDESVIALMFIFVVDPPFGRRQRFTLNNVDLKAVGPAS